ncbi:phosphodiester glycosidase family protein (plasmid) [Streptomyces sp. NBC_00335]|uniref:phosphodiester glycosidase family protein n=1 Tax=unclassified Streptomyces TaxID=2593676 RepID=UPI002253A36E|nr:MULTISPECIES: phosphodiester glycosidase family protein [unclassified Streptomyces]MCX5410124.1 phosphodiester glycosidase family protein [Streptomyces sp. NBC_00086]
MRQPPHLAVSSVAVLAVCALAALGAAPATGAAGRPTAAPSPVEAAAPEPSTLPFPESAQSTVIAPGVTQTSIVRGLTDADDVWTVHVNQPLTADGSYGQATAALGPKERADQVAAALRAKGFEPRVERVLIPAFADRPGGTLGWTVRIGRYADQRAATAALAQVRAAGFAGDTRYTAQDGTDADALQRVFVLRVDFKRFTGRLASDFGPSIDVHEKLPDLAAATGALAGVNAQWFAAGGASLGLYVKDGRLLGAATQGRGGFRITDGGRQLDVDTYSTRITVRAGGSTREIDGVNRIPGEIWNCGGVGGDQPTQHPKHDFKCTDASELVRFTPEWSTPPTGAGAEVVLDRDDRVTAVHRTRGAKAPAGGSTLQAIGESAEWLVAHARPGARLGITQRVLDGAGYDVPLTPDTTILQVGPTLVRDGRIAVNALADGIIREEGDQTFTYNWVVRGNPRSMIGVDGQGRLLLVVVDGRRAGWSEGLSVAASAKLMKSLGAREALNLDGGGSSAMVTAGSGVVNRPSDATGPRLLGNVLLLHGAAPGR